IKTADNRILQEQLQNKCSENKELQERITLLEQQLAAAHSQTTLSSSEQHGSEEYIDELRKKIQIQEVKNEKLKLEHVQILEENSGLLVQNQKLSEEASYAKELASAAAVELKNLAGEVTKLSLHSTKLEKELLAARELVNTRPGTGGNRKYGDATKPGRNGRISGRVNDSYNDFGSRSLDLEDLRRELQARKQHEACLEAALAEKEVTENEYKKKFDESKKKEASLENDLANMWVLVAQLKKEAGGNVPELNTNNEDHAEINENVNGPRLDNGDFDNSVLKERQVILDVQQLAHDVPKEEPLVARLRARMQEMKEKELNYNVNSDANSHCVNPVQIRESSSSFTYRWLVSSDTVVLASSSADVKRCFSSWPVIEKSTCINHQGLLIRTPDYRAKSGIVFVLQSKLAGEILELAHRFEHCLPLGDCVFLGDKPLCLGHAKSRYIILFLSAFEPNYRRCANVVVRMRGLHQVELYALAGDTLKDLNCSKNPCFHNILEFNFRDHC
ncbi:kinesin-like protein KIN-7D, mitochondrial, partial [Tanacetum coccineum]